MPLLTNLGGNYSLGLTNPPASLESQGVPDPFPAELTPYAETAGMAGNYRMLLLGRPVVKWKFGMLEQREFNVLLQYCKTGPTPVYLKTRVPSGTSNTYNTFSAVMQYPTEATMKAGGLWADVTFVFTDLSNA